MGKKIDEYNKKNYQCVNIRLKPKEKEKFDKILNIKKLSRRKYLVEKIEKEEV